MGRRMWMWFDVDGILRGGNLESRSFLFYQVPSGYDTDLRQGFWLRRRTWRLNPTYHLCASNDEVPGIQSLFCRRSLDDRNVLTTQLETDISLFEWICRAGMY